MLTPVRHQDRIERRYAALDGFSEAGITGVGPTRGSSEGLLQTVSIVQCKDRGTLLEFFLGYLLIVLILIMILTRRCYSEHQVSTSAELGRAAIQESLAALNDVTQAVQQAGNQYKGWSRTIQPPSP